MIAAREDMSVLKNRIISTVQRGSNEGSNENASQLTNNVSQDDTKRPASSSGSIGSFLASQNKRGKRNN